VRAVLPPAVTITNKTAAVADDDALAVGAIPAGAGIVAAVAGSTLTLKTKVTGTAGFAYQWFRNGVPIEGGTKAALTLKKLTAADTALYAVRVVNAAGAAYAAESSVGVVVRE